MLALPRKSSRKHNGMAWLARHQRWTSRFTPTSRSRLNAVETFLSALTRHRLNQVHGACSSPRACSAIAESLVIERLDPLRLLVSERREFPLPGAAMVRRVSLRSGQRIEPPGDRRISQRLQSRGQAPASSGAPS
jgi:hypothetical protein